MHFILWLVIVIVVVAACRCQYFLLFSVENLLNMRAFSQHKLLLLILSLSLHLTALSHSCSYARSLRRRRIRMYACIQRAKARILCSFTNQKCSYTQSMSQYSCSSIVCIDGKHFFLTQIQIVCVSDNLHFPIALSTRFISVSRACFRLLLLFLCFPYTFYMLTSSIRPLCILSHFSISLCVFVSE